MKINFGEGIVLQAEIKEEMSPQEACGYFEHLLKLVRSAARQTESLAPAISISGTKGGTKKQGGKIKNRVTALLEANPKGLTVSEISEHLGIERTSDMSTNMLNYFKKNIVSRTKKISTKGIPEYTYRKV